MNRINFVPTIHPIAVVIIARTRKQVNRMKHPRKKTSTCILCAMLLLLAGEGVAQNLDSLENVLKTGDLSSEKFLSICDDLSWYYLDEEFHKSKHYAEQGIERAKAVGNRLMEARLYRNLGVAYYMNSRMDTAHSLLNHALEKATEVKDEQLQAAIHGAIGNLHNVTGDCQEALAYYLKALPVFEANGNKERVRSLLGNIATLYYSMANLNQSEKYYVELEKESLDADDPYNLGRAYEGFSKIALKRKEFQSSLEYSERAAKIFREGGYKSSEAIAIQGIAMVYYQHYKEYDKAKEYALKALELSKETGYKADIVGSLNTLSYSLLPGRRHRSGCGDQVIK